MCKFWNSFIFPLQLKVEITIFQMIYFKFFSNILQKKEKIIQTLE